MSKNTLHPDVIASFRRVTDQTLTEMVQAEEAYPDEGEFNSTNDYLAYATAYMGRAAAGVYRNDRDGYGPLARRAMLIKAAGLLLRAASEME